MVVPTGSGEEVPKCPIRSWMSAPEEMTAMFEDDRSRYNTGRGKLSNKARASVICKRNMAIV